MRNIPQYSKYSISEDGKTIYNSATRHTLKQSVDKKGYVWVTLLIDEGAYELKRICVHRLVAFTYLEKPKENQVWVNHKDGVKGNNHYTNLEWTTISENIQHAVDSGLRKTPTGSGHWNYGRKVGRVTRNKMSKKKTGELHPKFKGWYVVGGVKYDSAKLASEKSGIERTKIFRWCKSGENDCSFINKNPAHI